MFYIYESGVVSKVLLPDGYLTLSGTRFTYHFYIKDHQGNVRVVMNRSRQIEQANHYYPFGGLFAASTAGAVQNYKYSGKELDRMNGLYLYDFSARAQDPMVGRFTTMDPLCEKYYSISPYAYCLNNPVNAIDSDGKLVIFINGMHTGSGGSSAYWSGFDNAVMKHLGDYNSLYRDGSGGGINNFPLNMNINNRIFYGYGQGNKDAKQIIEMISGKNGMIKETIKVITHSMGGAYAKGYTEALIEYFIKNGIPISLIEFEADFAPFQPTDQKATAGVYTLQFTNAGDNIAGNSFLGSPSGIIDGTEGLFFNSNNTKGHTISDFYDQIINLPTGKYRFENGEIAPY